MLGDPDDTRLHALLDRAISVFIDHFDTQPDHAASAPGRVNLIGEHTDYNDGFVLPMAIEPRTAIVAKANHSPRFRIVASDLDQQMATFINDGDIAPGRTQWSNYVKGVIAMFKKQGHGVPSFDAVIASDVPVGGGLSSSAALEVAVATLIEQFEQIIVEPTHKALWCQAAEHEFAGMPCGIMDQFITVMGRPQHALLIDCRSRQAQLVPLDDPQLTVVIANSNVKHDLADSEYPVRRAQCEQATAAIARQHPHVKSLRDATMPQLDDVRHAVDDVVYRRARHVIAEIQRTTLAADALRRVDYPAFGHLMHESHVSLRDDYQVSCPEIDGLVDQAEQFDGVYGSRITGGGFGGCTVTLVAADAAEPLIAHLRQAYSKQTGLEADCFATRPAGGARPIAIGGMK